MKHGNKDALSSSASFLCFLPLSMSPAARASGGDCDCCGRAVARSFNRPRLLAPRVVGGVRPPSHRHHSNLPPSCVRNLRLACVVCWPALLLTGAVAIMSRLRESQTSPGAWIQSWTPLYKITRRKETPKTHTKDSIFASLFINACDFRAH